MNTTKLAITGATTMNFNYQTSQAMKLKYLAILQNSAYQIPIPAHVAARIISKKYSSGIL